MKSQAWLRIVNKEHDNPLEVLGKMLEPYLEYEIDFNDSQGFEKVSRSERIEKALAKAGLQYIRGGHISRSVSLPSKTLEEIIRHLDATSINEEFDRALRNVEGNPEEGVSAACNILESICRIYIEDQGFDLPKKQDLHNLWTIIRKNSDLIQAWLKTRTFRKSSQA